jgi:hypothetical protein
LHDSRDGNRPCLRLELLVQGGEIYGLASMLLHKLLPLFEWHDAGRLSHSGDDRPGDDCWVGMRRRTSKQRGDARSSRDYLGSDNVNLTRTDAGQ